MAEESQDLTVERVFGAPSQQLRCTMQVARMDDKEHPIYK